jgi:hypothetical protein
MAEIIRNISSLDEFSYILENYKRKSELAQKELKFYLLNLENGGSLTEILEFLKEKGNGSRVDYKILTNQNGVELVYLKILKGSFKDGFPEAIMYLNKNTSNILFMSDEDGDKIKIIKGFVNKIFPFVSKKFIRSFEIREIISKLRKEGYQITASMVSIKRWWEKVKTSGVEYPKEVPIEKIFDDLDKQKSFINSITFNVFDADKKNKLMKAHISRKGLIKFLDGFYDLFQKNILDPLLTETEKEKRLLEKRNREEEKIKPLRVYFERLEDFSPIEITKQFAKSISQTNELSLAVMHNGNPYFYASITNNLDGSVFDIIFQNIREGSELILIPQYAVSSNSLSKFFSLVYSHFGEGEITEYNLN